MPVGKFRRAMRLAPSMLGILALTMVQGQVAASPGDVFSEPASAADINPACGDPDQDFHGGREADVVANVSGAVTRLYNKIPTLCIPSPLEEGSGSGSWVMLAVYPPPVSKADQQYYQVGIKRAPDDCPHFFMSYDRGPGYAPVNNVSAGCASSITWYRYDLKKWNGVPDDWWDARVFVDATNVVIWNAPSDPISLYWDPTDALFSSEVQNGRHDQAGGGNTSRLTFDAARWYTSSGTIVWANMQGTERFCDWCNGSTPSYPYNTQWYDGNTFEVWTDGY